jgi:hypothetical protein
MEACLFRDEDETTAEVSTLIGAPALSAKASRYSLGTVIWPFSPSEAVVRYTTGNVMGFLLTVLG